jgi:hypothetical protein
VPVLAQDLEKRLVRRERGGAGLAVEPEAHRGALQPRVGILRRLRHDEEL